MAAETLYRISAACLIVSGASLALGLLSHPTPPYAASVGTTQWAISHLFWWMGSVAGAVGVGGLYLRRREDVGLFGFVGSALAIVGLIVIASAMYFEAFIAPSVAARTPEVFAEFPAGGGWEGFLMGVLASGVAFGIGFLMLGFSLIRARVVPRWAITLAILGGVPFAVNFLLPRAVAMVAVVLFGLGLLGLGRALWKSVEVDSPPSKPKISIGGAPS